MNIISRVSQGDDSVRPGRMLSALKSLQRREFIDYLQEIVSEATLLENIARRSSVHANGFTKLVLERSTGMALRLHIWEPVERSSDISLSENIHDHVWPFASRVLVGGLYEERFDRYRTGMLMDHYRYVRGRTTLPPGNLLMNGQVRLGVHAELSHKAGSVYEVDDSVLHRAHNIGETGFSATLMMTGMPRLTPASVYAPTGMSVREDARESQVSDTDALRLLGTVIEALK